MCGLAFVGWEGGGMGVKGVLAEVLHYIATLHYDGEVMQVLAGAAVQLPAETG